MTDTWKVQDAKARFSELLDTMIERGPQVVTRRGVPTAIVVSFDDWQGQVLRPRPTLKDLLLAPYARTDNLVPPRRKHRLRKPPKF